MSRFISVLPLSGRTENWQVKCSVSSTVIPTQGDTVRRFTTVIPLRPKKEGQIAFDEVLGVEMEKHVDSDGEGFRIVQRYKGDKNFPLNSHFEAKEGLLDCFSQVHETVLQTPALDKSAQSSDWLLRDLQRKLPKLVKTAKPQQSILQVCINARNQFFATPPIGYPIYRGW